MADRSVTAISRWLAHHSSDDELRRELEAIDLVDLTPTQAEAVLELQNELDVNTDRPAVEDRPRGTRSHRGRGLIFTQR